MEYQQRDRAVVEIAEADGMQMSGAKDMAGQRVGRLSVLTRAEKPQGGRGAYWLCRCDCGSERVVKGSKLRLGESKTCGCLRSDVSSVRLRRRKGGRYFRLNHWDGDPT